jgi:hypothetical protein
LLISEKVQIIWTFFFAKEKIMDSQGKKVQQIVVTLPPLTPEQEEAQAQGKEVHRIPVIESLPDEMIDFLARVILSLHKEGKL